MAFSALILQFDAEEQKEGNSIKIWDESIWTGESGLVTDAIVLIEYYDEDDVLTDFDQYSLAPGGIMTRFNQFLDREDGHVILIENTAIDGVFNLNTDHFADGYYRITLSVTDGTYGLYGDGLWPSVTVSRGFLAKADFMARKLPNSILTWPMTDEVRVANRDIFLQRMYLDAAKDSASFQKFDEFRILVMIINGIFSYYEVENIW